MHIDRLFEIVYMLLNKKNITAKILAEHFNVSVRTIYRDLDTLSNSNIPVYTQKGKNGGIRLLDNFVIDSSLFTSKEQNELLFMLKGMEKLLPGYGETALKKIAGIFNKKSYDWIDIDFSSWGNNIQEDTFDIIKEAIINCKVIEFDYYNSNGELSTREVEPIQIFFKDKTWYLKTYCLLKKEFRLFKISRIKNIKTTDKLFLPKEYIQNNTNMNYAMIDLKLKINKKMAYRVYDEFKQENITLDKDSNFIIDVSFKEDEWVYSYILSYGEDIQVIKPVHVKNIINKKASNILKNNI